MSRLRPLKTRSVLAALARLGYIPLQGRGKGAHMVLFHPTLERYTTIAYHGGSGMIPKGTLKRILANLEMEWEDFERLV